MSISLKGSRGYRETNYPIFEPHPDGEADFDHLEAAGLGAGRGGGVFMFIDQYHNES